MKIFTLPWVFLASIILLAATLSAQLTPLTLNNPGAIDGQNGWIYNPGTGTRSSEVRGEPGGLFRVASDGGILPASARHFYTRAGLDSNPRMNSFAARPVTLSGTTYVRFLVRLESRAPAAFGSDPNEFFFGFAPDVTGSGFPLAFAALKVPVGGAGAGLEAVGPGLEGEGIVGQFFPDARVALDETLFVVARFNLNEAGHLTGVDLWLDPESGDGGSPDYSTTFPEAGPRVIGDTVEGVAGNASFRFRAQNMPSRIDNLAIGRSWADVVPAAYTGPSPRPPVILAAPRDVVGMLGEQWNARAVAVESAAAAAAVTVGERETVAIFMVDSPAQISSYQWMFNTWTAIPAGSGGNLATMPFILHTGIQIGSPVRLPIGGANSIAARALLAAGGNIQTENARLAETPSTEIIAQPVSRTVLDGDRVTLSVTVDSPFDVSYQWFGPDGALEGATDRTLSFNPARVADTGENFVVVTDELENSFQSDSATLTVVEFTIPEDARVVRLFPSPSLGDVIEFDGIVDDQIGGELSPHDPEDEPETVASIPRGLFNARIGAAYNDGRGGVFDFNLETAELVSGLPKPTAPGATEFLPFDYPPLRDGPNNLIRDEDGNLQFNNTLDPSPGLGYIGELLLRIGEDRDIRVVPNVRNSGGFVDGYAGRESGAPNYLHVTGLLPHPNGFLVTDPFPLATIFPHSPSGSGQAASSEPYVLGANSFIELAFDPEDLITLTGFVFINRNYFQSHRTTKDFANKPNVRATATFVNGDSRVDLISTGFTYHGDDGPGLGQNTFFGFESPEEGYYLERIEVWGLGNNFRLLFDIGDLAVAVESEEGALPTIISQPESVSIAENGTAEFLVGVNASGELSYRWQSSFDGGETFSNLPDGGFFGATLSGAFTDTLTVSSAPLMLDGMIFRVRVTDGETVVFSDPATLTVLPASLPVFLSSPVSCTAREQSAADFTVSVEGFPEPAVRWQVSTDGGASYVDLTEGGPYSGVQTTSLTVMPVTLAMDGHRFRAVAQNSAGTVQSVSAWLTVTPLPSLPVFTLEPEDQAVAEGTEVIFRAGASGFPSPAFQWQISIDGGFSFSNITDGSFGGNLFRDTQTADLRILSASPFVDGVFFRVRASNSEGVVFSRGAQLSILTILSLDEWLAAAGVPADRRGPADRHGPLQLTNLEAYGMGLLPFAASAEDLPRLEPAENGSNVLRFHYRVNTRAEGAPVAIEGSTDLVSWVPAEPLEERLLWEMDGVEGREAVFDHAETRFLRLRVGETAPSAPGDMVLVEGGTLAMSMGTVTVDSFYMGIYEVTWGEWKAVRAWGEANGYGWYEGSDGVPGGCADDHPVYNINWLDALKWSNAKSEMEGLTPVYSVDGAIYRTGERSSGISQNLSADGYRLPLEAEWEFAARGGNQTHGYTYAGSNDLNAVGWFNGNSGGAACDLWEDLGTWPVGQKLPNELGLHDMSGNVAEWCWDEDFFERRLRGGSWRSSAFNSTVSNHSLNRHDRRWPDLGFRLVRTP